MTRLIAVLLVGAALASSALAVYDGAPEIDVNTGLGALTLLSGAALVIRARVRK